MRILLIFFVDDLVAPRIVAERLYKAQKDIPSESFPFPRLGL